MSEETKQIDDGGPGALHGASDPIKQVLTPDHLMVFCLKKQMGERCAAHVVQLWNAFIESGLEKPEEIVAMRKAAVPICVGPPLISILAEEGQWISVDGQGIFAADGLFRQDPYKELGAAKAENEKMRAALVSNLAFLEVTREQCAVNCDHDSRFVVEILKAREALAGSGGKEVPNEV